MILSDKIVALEEELAELKHQLKSQLSTEGDHGIIHARIDATTNLLTELMKQNSQTGFPVNSSKNIEEDVPF